MMESTNEEDINKTFEESKEDIQNPEQKPRILMPQPTEIPAAAHYRKNWKSYLWEFIMLFLAVFCGFIANYQLDSKIERDKVKEFASSFVQDLINDTNLINSYIKTGEVYISATDSLYTLGQTLLEGQNATKFSFYTRFMYWTSPMAWNRATFEQIKNSGGLRYFKNYQLLQKMMKYEAMIKEVEGEDENRKIRGNMLLQQINQMIDPSLHHDLSGHRISELDAMSLESMSRHFSFKIESLEPKRNAVNELINMALVQQRNILYNNDTRLKPAKKIAKELISDLKKEYHIH